MKRSRRIAALMLALVMMITILPTNLSVKAAEKPGTELPGYIFSETWNADYDVLYHEPGKEYTYKGEKVTFVSEESLTVGTEEFAIRNKEVVPAVVTRDGITEVTFPGLMYPAGAIAAGPWYTFYTALDYTLDGTHVRTEGTLDIADQKLVFEHLEEGTHTLTNGTIYEAARQIYPRDGYDFGDGKGKVSGRLFGYLPDVTFKVKKSTDAESVIRKINALPDADSLTLKDRDAVDAAGNAYESLTVEAQDQVTNAEKLFAADKKIIELLDGRFADGVYEGTGRGKFSDIIVKVTIKNGKILSVEEVEHADTESFFERAKLAFDRIVKRQDADVDAVSGATGSSGGIISAAKEALKKAEDAKAAEEEAKEEAKVRLEVKYKSDAKSVRLSWNKIPGADGYEVYRYDSASKKYKGLTRTGADTTSYTVKRVNGRSGSALKPASGYRFMVRAYVIMDGKKSYKKQEVLNTYTKPGKVKLVSVKKAGKKKVKLTWKKSAKNSGYQILMKHGKKSYKAIKNIKGGKKQVYTVSGLKKNTKYSFRVRAYKTAGSVRLYGETSNVKTIKVK